MTRRDERQVCGVSQTVQPVEKGAPVVKFMLTRLANVRFEQGFRAKWVIHGFWKATKVVPTNFFNRLAPSRTQVPRDGTFSRESGTLSIASVACETGLSRIAAAATRLLLGFLPIQRNRSVRGVPTYVRRSAVTAPPALLPR